MKNTVSNQAGERTQNPWGTEGGVGEQDRPGRTQHTPGPWLRDGVTVFVDLRDGLNACDIAVMVNDGNLPLATKEANARLIAAAPELLEGAKAVADRITTLQELGVNLGLADEGDEAGIMVSLLAAISKAEGSK